MCHNVHPRQRWLACLWLASHPSLLPERVCICVCLSVSGCVGYIQHKEFMSRWMACTARRNWMTRCNSVDTRRRVSVENDVSSLVPRLCSCSDWTGSVDKMQCNPGSRQPNAAKRPHLCLTVHLFCMFWEKTKTPGHTHTRTRTHTTCTQYSECLTLCLLCPLCAILPVPGFHQGLFCDISSCDSCSSLFLFFFKTRSFMQTQQNTHSCCLGLSSAIEPLIEWTVSPASSSVMSTTLPDLIWYENIAHYRNEKNES